MKNNFHFWKQLSLAHRLSIFTLITIILFPLTTSITGLRAYAINPIQVKPQIIQPAPTLVITGVITPVPSPILITGTPIPVPSPILVTLTPTPNITSTPTPTLTPVPTLAIYATCMGRNATIVNTQEYSYVYGTEGDDVIVSAAYSNIYGLGGNDIICGKGYSNIYGGEGDDIIDGGGVNNIILGGNGNDTIFTRAGLGNTGLVDEANAQKGIPGTNCSTILEPDFSNLYGEAGDDTLVGCGGQDTLDGENGDDKIFGYGGAYMISGGGGKDLIYGGNGVDITHPWIGDYISGGSGEDTIYGRDGNDEIYGDADNDKIFGEAGNDSLYGGGGDDLIKGGEGNDGLYGGEGNDTLDGGPGFDDIDGGPGNNLCNNGEMTSNCMIPTSTPTSTPTPTNTPTPTSTPTPLPNHLPVIITSQLPAGKVNQKYLEVVSGYDKDVKDKLTMKITNLPTGLSQGPCAESIDKILQRKNIQCTISGKPKKTGIFNFLATLSDNRGGNTKKTLKLTIFK